MKEKIAKLGTAELSVRWVSLKQEVRLISVHPAMNVVSIKAKGDGFNVVIKETDFGADVQSAKQLFDNIKMCFNVK